ncbi:xanthine dehydrogenase family protein molybdopterin-binding subunit [Terriglobus roseus]|uniref:Isoquinoline 1-oxidoreductase, beta subunit n=1 Tax=Terriglobus roseus TaxID=392734 RepID=A0A1H4SFU0_9BACT|nr:molybdopterin cofactor-binding domain-containing protein [Terriglobus roseus]SEC42930.1 isoquinoline 1-oxidoreductase, beta subunit [Terriglobus roseus]
MPTLENTYAQQLTQFDADMQSLIAEMHTLPSAAPTFGRRDFLKKVALAGGGLALMFQLDTNPAHAAVLELAGAATSPGPSVLNAFVRIAPDNTITIFSKGPEIGQGIKTAFGLIIAEELDADWKNVTVDQAPINPKVYGSQSAGGSTSIPRGWDQLRQAGAAARAMLVAAAAEQWKVPAKECTTSDSQAFHQASGRKLTYGELAIAASAQPVPDAASLPLKARADWKLLGKRFSGVGNRSIVTGQPIFGIDVQLPGMVYANYTKCPAVGGKVKSANLDEIKRLPGILDAFVLEGNGNPAEVMPGVAIIGKSTWEVFKAKSALKVDWDETSASKDSLTAAAAKAKEISTKLPAPATNIGDVDAAFASAAKVVEAAYDYAMISHQQLEPDNGTAWFHDGGIELWTPSQVADRGIPQVAKLLNLPEDKVTIHQTRAGGGFGRRLANDYLLESVAIAAKLKVPVKLQWMREDDFAHDMFRAPGFHYLKGSVDTSGKLTAFQNHIVSFTAGENRPISGGGRSNNSFPTDIAPNTRYAISLLPLQIPCGPMRAPTDNTQMFVVGSFLHELSVAAGRDHVEFLLEWFHRAETAGPDARKGGPAPAGAPIENAGARAGTFNASRASGVLKLAAEKAGWGKKLPPGRGMGIAFSFAYGGHVAEVVELSVDAKKHITIHNIVAVADIGPIVNMSSAENQVQGGVIDGLSTAMGLQIDVENGRIKQTNFHAYPILRMRAAPPVEAHFIQSDFRPSGLGEPCLPPLAPALGNAIFAATGDRVRSMPFSRSGYTI